MLFSLELGISAKSGNAIIITMIRQFIRVIFCFIRIPLNFPYYIDDFNTGKLALDKVIKTERRL